MQTDHAESAYVSSIRALVMFLGFLFVMSLSHDAINREVENQTIRFLVTKSARSSIVIGKFLGIFLFWLICILCSFIVIGLFAKQIFVFDFLQIMCFIAYAVSLTILISLVIKKPSHTTFASILLGIALPVVGLWSVISTKFISEIIKYILPYYYIVKGGYYIIFPFFLSILMLLTALAIFQRRDL
ncbi:ABC transporter permease [Ureibacillus terrenus]|uniref:ABC transporter permease n=1 Tax=Ureibacillus terrenus TaxID=118246 RepID=UPI0015EFC440|nr:ABC transporter permease subunit [Ureibacillus terrenus]MED3660688.1 ABC transporter permease subunit [Ureibacillus terrenus]MED3762807.1 ABC transporter permease subunit [Ureibacillus terrenus]